MKFIVGIDEVGRGPIAGPVAVGAFVILNNDILNDFIGVKESKQLSAKKREIWFEKIQNFKKDNKVNFSVNFQSEKVIDSMGISYAIRAALSECLNELNLQTDMVEVLLDGGLKAPASYINQKTIIKGDEKEIVIALASICAKVMRDRLMIDLSNKYDKYGFEKHMGYGTKAHYKAIEQYGITPVHRTSFLSKILQKKHK
jgi:ribonuclease HII